MSPKPIVVTALLLSVVVGGSLAEAGQRSRSRSGGQSAGRAAPRTYAPRHNNRPNVVRVVPYRSHYYRPRVGVSFYSGYPYGFYPYGYPYGYAGYGYAPYGYRSYGYAPYPYSYGYGGAGYGGDAYGGVRITDAPRDAQVFVDGYYVGVVDDFDGTFQHVNLEAGPHRVEIRPPGDAPVSFDVNVQPGRTITYRANP